MSTNRLDPAKAQAPAHPSQQFEIRLERALMLIARDHLDVRTACRKVGLRSHESAREVRRICDRRGILRRHWWGRPLPNWKTAEPCPVYVKPRDP